MKDLLLCDNDETQIQDIMSTNVISVTTLTDKEEVAKMLSHYDFLALPVVDNEDRMVGIVTFDDAMDVLEEETTEDMALMCGVVLAAVCFLKIWLVDSLLLGNEDITVTVNVVVCLALLVTVLMAKLIGAALPLLAKAVHLDPAVMAGPFITSIVDALSLLVFFLFARLLLGM